VVSLQEKLRATLDEVVLWKERAQKISCSRKGGFSASMDLHTLAPVGSSPLQSPVMRSPLMASDSHESDIPEFEMEDVARRVATSRHKKTESSMDSPMESNGDEAVDARVCITSPPIHPLGKGMMRGLGNHKDDQKLSHLLMEMDDASDGASAMDPIARNIRLNPRVSSKIESFMHPQT